MSKRIKTIQLETHLSGYQLMWIIVMFDLPVDTREHARAATKFREFLLDEGFEMAQFSVYARFVNGKEHFDTYVRRIGRNLPLRGEIHILQFTDKQYENIIRFSTQSRRPTRKNPDQLALF
jgi:CRISPR-associated protein Cas2